MQREKGREERCRTRADFGFAFALQQRGYASLLEVSTIALVLSSDPEDDPKTTVSPCLLRRGKNASKLSSFSRASQLEISQINIRFTPCADSIVTLGAVAGDLAKLVLLS